jgi:hypothetical protein
MSRLTAFFFMALLALTVNTRPAAAEEESSREKLGLRLGYLHSASDIKIQFGHGSVIQLHFTEKIKPPLFITVSLGALYLGESVSDNITQFLFGPGVSDANMRILTLTLAPTLELPIYDKGILYLSTGAGLYSISVLLEMGIFASDTSNEHFGVNFGTGYYYPISDNWMLDFNFTFHHVWTPEIDKDLSTWSPIYDPRDLFWLYSYGDSDPNFYQISIGAAVSLN